MAEATKSQADSDELAAFVSSTLLAITKAVRHVQDDMESPGNKGNGFHLSPPNEVEFDVAVTAKNETSREGGLKLVVFSVSASADRKRLSEQSSVSRVKFTIPIGKNEK